MNIPNDYNPWLNGDASWLNGKHNGNGIVVDIDTAYSTISVEIDNGDEYFLQGDEADNLIKELAWTATNIYPNKPFSDNVIEYCSMLF